MRSTDRGIRLMPVLAAVALALGGGAAIGFAFGADDRRNGEPIVREALAQTTAPRGAKGRTLALTRITIQPGTKLALHHHRGTQIAYVEAGVLTYTVESGVVKIRRGPADERPRLVRKVAAGETARIRPGRWVVEQPSTQHHAANRGERPVVLYLSTLFRHGAPPSIAG